MPQANILEFTEYTTRIFSQSEFPTIWGETLWKEYGSKISVEFPTPKTNHQWEITPLGWVGYIPLDENTLLGLKPKVSIDNLFRMLEYAYHLKSFHLLDGAVELKSLMDFYERLANILSRRILDRSRKGLYRSYIGYQDRLPYVRGRFNVKAAMRLAWDLNISCDYEEHTTDLADNQILHWTMWNVLCSGLCTERVLPAVRHAYRRLQAFVTPTAHPSGSCIRRLYNRLNEDYQPMHALCRFFLEHSGPSHHVGDRSMIPFLIDMAHLYEAFVTEWLRQNLPADLLLEDQHIVQIDDGNNLHFRIDIVISDRATGSTKYVIDAKYKIEPTATHDLQEVVSYAVSKGCRDAILVYPVQSRRPLDTKVGDIRVRSLTFSLQDNLETAGNEFLRDLLGA